MELSNFQNKSAEPENYLNLLLEANPILFHFFLAFDIEGEKAFFYYKEIVNRLYDSLDKLDPKQKLSLTLFRGALKLLLKEEKVKTLEFLGKIKETIYEESKLQYLGDQFFLEDALPDRESLLQMRKIQLNSARRFLFDLIFLEGLTSNQVASLFNLSDAVLEAHLFTLIDQLMGYPKRGDSTLNELEEFLGFINQKNTNFDLTIPFQQRLKRIIQGLRIDFRSRFETGLINLEIKNKFPDFIFPEQNKQSNSIIEQIRKQNELKRLEEQELANSEPIAYSQEHFRSQEPALASKYLKPALGILGIFLIASFYETIKGNNNVTVLEKEIFNQPISLDTALNKEATLAWFEENGQKIKVGLGAYLKTGSFDGFLTNNNLNINLMPATTLRVLAEDSYFLDSGAIKITVLKESFSCSTSHGLVSGEKGSYQLAKLETQYSVAGALDGSLKITSYELEKTIKSGQEVSFGNVEKLIAKDFNQASYLRSSDSGFYAQSENTFSLFDADFTNKTKTNFLITEDMLKEPLETKIKDFLLDI